MKIRVQEYIRPDGASPCRDWFDGLDVQAAAKVTTVKLRMELGNASNVNGFAGIGEYVIDWGLGYRIYRAKDGETLALHAGYKARKTRPPADDTAKRRKR